MTGPPKQHDFAERFADADDPIVQARAIEVITYEFDAVHVQRTERAEDRAGNDFWAVLRGGNRIGVDIKNRKRDFDDVLLEIVSVSTEGAVGWALDDTKRTGYLLTLWPKRYLIIDYPRLRALVKRNRHLYLERYGSLSTGTEDRYETHFVGVPIGRLIADLFGFPAPYGYPLTKPRECPSCRDWHPVGTTCAGGWAPAAGSL